MARFVCEHGVVHHVETETVITEMGFDHKLVSTEFACTECPVSVLLDQQIEVD